MTIHCHYREISVMFCFFLSSLTGSFFYFHFWTASITGTQNHWRYARNAPRFLNGLVRCFQCVSSGLFMCNFSRWFAKHARVSSWERANYMISIPQNLFNLCTSSRSYYFQYMRARLQCWPIFTVNWQVFGSGKMRNEQTFQSETTCWTSAWPHFS